MIMLLSCCCGGGDAAAVLLRVLLRVLLVCDGAGVGGMLSNSWMVMDELDSSASCTFWWSTVARKVGGGIGGYDGDCWCMERRCSSSSLCSSMSCCCSDNCCCRLFARSVVAVILSFKMWFSFFFSSYLTFNVIVRSRQLELSPCNPIEVRCAVCSSQASPVQWWGCRSLVIQMQEPRSHI